MAKPNMSLEKVKMPEQEPQIRNRNFEEVALGYTEEMAIEEAKRCLQCKHRPCVAGCPVNVKIPDFIGLIAEGKFEEAYQCIRETNALPAFAAGFALRKPSVRSSVSGAKRVSRWALVVWSGLLPTGI